MVEDEFKLLQRIGDPSKIIKWPTYYLLFKKNYILTT